MSSLTKLARLLPGALSFQKAAVPALLIQGQINFETYGLTHLALFSSPLCWKKYQKIRIKLHLSSTPKAAAMLKRTLLLKKLLKLPKGTKPKSGHSRKNGPLMQDSCFFRQGIVYLLTRRAWWEELKLVNQSCFMASLKITYRQ